MHVATHFRVQFATSSRNSPSSRPPPLLPSTPLARASSCPARSRDAPSAAASRSALRRCVAPSGTVERCDVHDERVDCNLRFRVEAHRIADGDSASDESSRLAAIRHRWLAGLFLFGGTLCKMP